MTEQIDLEVPVPPSLEEVLRQWAKDQGFVGSPREQDYLRSLQAVLVTRENQIADFLRLAGVKFNLFPQVVSKVLMDVGIGEPVTDEQRRYIDGQFADLLQHLRDEHGFGPPA